MSDSDDNSEREEARLLLKAVRAQRQLHQLEQDVILTQLAEHAAIGELYKFQAVQAQKKLDTTEYDLGCLCNSIRKNGIVLADLPSTRKWRRLSNETSTSSVMFVLHSFCALLLTQLCVDGEVQPCYRWYIVHSVSYVL